jgi:hypothetical protein
MAKFVEAWSVAWHCRMPPAGKSRIAATHLRLESILAGNDSHLSLKPNFFGLYRRDSTWNSGERLNSGEFEVLFVARILNFVTNDVP